MEKRVVICCGSGGVGKTTTAAALGIRAAALGRKTLVLTIDPARRLADALGIPPLEHRPTRVPQTTLRAAGATGRGMLDAMVLDAKVALDEVVRRYAPSARVRDTILANPLYRFGSRALVESPEYLAMETLNALESEGSWELLVVDTPPTRHALDFFSAPRRMVEFLERNRFLALMTPRGKEALSGQRIVGMSVAMVLRVIARVTGSQLLEAAQEFFTAFEGMFEGFRERAARMERLLRSEATSTVIVTSPEPHALSEARVLLSTFAVEGIPVGSLIVNRVAVDPVPDATLRAWASGAKPTARRLAGTLALPGLTLRDRGRAEAMIENYLLYRKLAARDRAAIGGLGDLGLPPGAVHVVPELEDEVVRLEGLRKFLRHLGRPGRTERTAG
jgi:anion-transporting  ArsA/GET3 family ATPase